jgi:hypothetical protein
MPLADVSGSVAILAKYLGPKFKFVGVVGGAGIGAFHAQAGHIVLLQPRQHAGPGGHAPGTHVGVLESNAPVGQPIDVGRVHPIVSPFVAANGAVALVVGEDKENVRPVGVGGYQCRQ